MNSFVVGFSAGFLVGVLLAPRSGQNVRTLIRRQTGEFRESALDWMDRGRDAVARQVERLASPQTHGNEVYQR